MRENSLYAADNTTQATARTQTPSRGERVSTNDTEARACVEDIIHNTHNPGWREHVWGRLSRDALRAAPLPWRELG